jgi:putative NADPH-quinone reductase
MGKHTNQQDYFDNVLIKLKRLYSKDEAVAALTKKLAEVEINLGKALAYNLELKYKNSQLQKIEIKHQEKHKQMQARLDQFDLEARENKLLQSAQKKNSELLAQIKKIRETNADLVNKLCVLDKNQTNEIS